MKKPILSLALATVALSACAQHTLTAKLSGLTSDTVTIGLVNAEMTAMERTDTVLAKGGEFTYDVTGDKVRLANISFKTADGKGRFQVYLVPGEQGTLTGSTENATWGGSAFYTELAAFEATTEPVSNEMAKIGEDFTKQVKAGANADSLRNAVMPRYSELQKKLATIKMDYIKAHPSSGVSVTLLSEVEDGEAAYNTLTAEAKTGVFSPIAESAKRRIDKDNARREAAKLVADGCVAPDFTLNDINGKPLALSSLRGKYLILDFWGSWCGWCIKGMPKMKEYYAKYAGKLEILGVDCNDTEAKWKAAVAKHEIPWKHVYNPRSSDVLTKYAVEGFPTKIVIDPQGKIVKTVVGEDPAFYTFLDELLK